MIIRWHGHACFEVSNDHVIVTDPHDGKSIGIKRPQVKGDLVLVSHGHFDHNSVKSVLKSSTKTIDSPGKHREFDIEVKGIQVFHDDSNGERRGKNCIFKFNIDGINICHLGDLGHIPTPEQVEDIGPMDILFVPIGNVFTIGAQDAWKTIKMLKPKVAIPMHYRVGGLSLSIQPIDPFLTNADKIEHVGNEIDFEPEDLPQDFEVWVFSL
ncbi:MAG: MBL fold metallo-hydrolase [Thermoplasmata archaeon]|nr:MBL fold metallo-hydrolase [Thermoplasmata archaeon]